MSPVVEQWFVTCLFVIGPRGERTTAQYTADAIEFFTNYIPNGSGCGWYGHWFVVWVKRELKARNDGH